jgi:hypothetical protein
MYLLDTLAGCFRPSGGVEAPAEAVASRDTALLEDLKRYMARATAMWQVEKDSETHKLDDAKRIIRGIADNILRVATSLNDQRKLDLEVAMTLAKEARTLERHELYMDGGRSYNAFWELGDSIIKRTSELSGA